MAEQIRWGILGTASIAETFARGISLSENSVLAAIASRSIHKAEDWAKQYEVPHVFGSYEALIDSGLVDAIYNPLPNSLHAAWTIRALEAGIPVLCEKPFTGTADEAREVARVSRVTGVPVVEGFMYRFHPLYDCLLNYLRAIGIGEITCIASTFTWCLDDYTQISASEKLAGGALMDVGCYPVNFARLITGEEPISVCAYQRGKGVDYTMAGLLKFPSGTIGEIECSIESHERVRAEILGTRGSIVLESPWNPGNETASFVVHKEGQTERITTSGANRFMLEIEDFVAVIRGEAQPRWPVEDAVDNMIVLDALRLSAKSGKMIDIYQK